MLILFNSDRTGQLELYARNFDGLFVQQFTFDEGNEFNGVRRPSISD
jgi:Tol biopolymer transport system component